MRWLANGGIITTVGVRGGAVGLLCCSPLRYDLGEMRVSGLPIQMKLIFPSAFNSRDFFLTKKHNRSILPADDKAWDLVDQWLYYE